MDFLYRDAVEIGQIGYRESPVIGFTMFGWYGFGLSALRVGDGVNPNPGLRWR